MSQYVATFKNVEYSIQKGLFIGTEPLISISPALCPVVEQNESH